MNIYLIRHARSFPRGGLLYEEDARADLSAFGECEAWLLSRYLKRRGIVPEVFVTSPMVRARQTTDILNRGSVPVETDGRLAEFKYPAEFSEKHKLRTLKSRTQHEWEYTPGPSGESFVQCGGRLISALNDIVQRPHKNVCIVSHAFIMQCAFSGLFNLKELLMFGTASVSLITFTDGKFKLGFTNQVLPRRSILACKAVSFPVRVLRGLKKRMLKK